MADADTAEELEGPPEDRPMTLSEHLEELRRRVLRSVLFVAVGAAVAFYFQAELLAIVVEPVNEVLGRHDIGALQVFEIPELFFASVKISLVFGLFGAAPLVGHQVWQFVATGLYPKERRWITIFAPLSYLLFMGGAAFFYFVILPQILEILLTWDLGKIPVEVNPQVGSYLGIFLGMALVMGVVFQLPIMMMILQLTGLVSWRTFAKYRRHFIVGGLVVAAVITPTGDAVSLGLVMLPVLVLFEVGLIICRILGRKRDAEEAA